MNPLRPLLSFPLAFTLSRNIEIIVCRCERACVCGWHSRKEACNYQGDRPSSCTFALQSRYNMHRAFSRRIQPLLVTIIFLPTEPSHTYVCTFPFSFAKLPLRFHDISLLRWFFLSQLDRNKCWKPVTNGDKLLLIESIDGDMDSVLRIHRRPAKRDASDVNTNTTTCPILMVNTMNRECPEQKGTRPCVKSFILPTSHTR